MIRLTSKNLVLDRVSATGAVESKYYYPYTAGQTRHGVIIFLFDTLLVLVGNIFSVK